MMDTTDLVEEVVKNPLAMATIVQNFMNMFQLKYKQPGNIAGQLLNDLTQEFENGTSPFENGLVKAVATILQIHFMHNVNASDLAEGNFRGVETRTKLLAAHCLYIGLVAKFDEQFTLAVEWLKEAKRLDEVEGPGAIAIVQAQLAELRTEHEDLPRLPLPDLESTLQGYLDAVQPILDPEQFEKVQGLAKQLAENEGPLLQHHLADRQLKMNNWAYEWWVNELYLNDPAPLPVNSSACIAWPLQNFNTIEDQLHFAAQITTFMLDFKDVLNRNELPTEKAVSRKPGQPLCMAQYFRLLGTCRIPCLPRDYHRRASSRVYDHIIVAYRSHFFKCPTRVQKRRLTTSEILQQFQAIFLADVSPNDTPVGILTTQMRPIWAEERSNLRANDTNRSSVEEIETCLFIISFDDPLPPERFNAKDSTNAKNNIVTESTRIDEVNLSHHLLHGGGSALNAGNRWFDKTVQFVISSDGAVGLCVEDSFADGVCLSKLTADFLTRFKEWKTCYQEEADPANSIPLPVQLEWSISAESQNRSIRGD